MTGDKKIGVVLALFALLAINGVVEGSPLCRYWLMSCCCGKGQGSQAQNVSPAVASAGYQQDAAAPELSKNAESNDIAGETELPDAVKPTSISEPSEGEVVLPGGGARVPRHTPLQVQVPTRAVSLGYPQPVGNARAEGYTVYPGFGAYKVHRVGVAWYDALRVCASEGATLAVATSQAGADLLKTMFNNEEVPDAVNNMHLWVGAQERGVDGQFYTVYGDLLERSGYMSWSPYGGGQPNDKGNTDCVSIFVEGTYFDDECTSKYGFVCEKIL